MTDLTQRLKENFDYYEIDSDLHDVLVECVAALEFAEQHANDYGDAHKDNWMTRHEQLEERCESALNKLREVLK